MVRQISRSRGLYTAKVAKAAGTPSGFSTWVEVAQGTLVQSVMFNPYGIWNEHWTRGCCCIKGT